eukprot:snap_masked-scaffold_6-processed-gene-2.7-mRNA-1 protein AED:1.00 eAED:1.00 QI:0/0/0/0/1/1/2/0/382
MDFGEKLFQRGSLLDADFKPVVTWNNLERREYMNRAMQKHRKKKKQEHIEDFVTNLYLHGELNKLQMQQTKLTKLKNLLERNRAESSSVWGDPYLMKRNEILRSEIVKCRAQSYIMAKFSVLGEYANYFETKNFQENLDWTLKRCFELLNELKVTKHGKLFVFSKEYKTIPNRKKARDEVNKIIKDNEVKYGNLLLKTVVSDKKKEKCLSHTFKVEGVDFFEYVEVMYDVWRYNKYEVCTFRDSWWDAIVYDVVDIDTRKVPFYCPPELKHVSFDFQAITIAFHKSKGSFPSMFTVTALYRNNKFALIIKCGMVENADKTGFHPFKNSMTCALITRMAGSGKAVQVKTASEYFPPGEWEEILCVYAAITLQLKKNHLGLSLF